MSYKVCIVLVVLAMLMTGAIIAQDAPQVSDDSCFYTRRPRLGIEPASVIRESNIYSEASIGSDVLRIIDGVDVDIVSGPVCSEGFYWYQVTFQNVSGWMIESIGDLSALNYSTGNSRNYSPTAIAASHAQVQLIGWWVQGNSSTTGVSDDADLILMSDGLYYQRNIQYGDVSGTYLFYDGTLEIHVVENVSTGQSLDYTMRYSMNTYGSIMMLTDSSGTTNYSGVYPAEYTNADSARFGLSPEYMLPMPDGSLPMCIEAAAGDSDPWPFSWVSVANAARFEPGQCTDWLDQQYPELVAACLPGNDADAYRWDELFQANCNFPVSDVPHIGDIAVWERSFVRPWGHVAYVESVNPNGVWVSEYNVGRIARYAARGERPPEALENMYPVSDMKYINITEGTCLWARAIEPLKLSAPWHPSYLVVSPDNPLSLREDTGLFIFHDGNAWRGVTFTKIREVDGTLAFLVDANWERANPNWHGYYMRYIYAARPNAAVNN